MLILAVAGELGSNQSLNVQVKINEFHTNNDGTINNCSVKLFNRTKTK